MNEANDELEYSIDGVKKIAMEMRENNGINKENKEKFLEYIETNLAPEWNTTQGVVAVEELRTFVNTSFQEYIDFLDSKIDLIEEIVIPGLVEIDNA